MKVETVDRKLKSDRRDILFRTLDIYTYIHTYYIQVETVKSETG